MEATGRRFPVTRRGLASLVAAALLLAGGCRTKPPAAGAVTAADSLRIVAGILAFRAERDSFLLHAADSPLPRGAGEHRTAPAWYPPDLRFHFRSKLMRYTFPRPVTVYGTKGEARRLERYGYFELAFGDTVCRLNVYRPDPADRGAHGVYLSVAFTDETTGKETYGVGRYLPVADESPDRGHLYEVDFNKATNPYCAYNDDYTCAVPLREDHLPVAITAGEKKYHP